MPDQEKRQRLLRIQSDFEQAEKAGLDFYANVVQTMNTDWEYREAVSNLAVSRAGLVTRDLPLDDLVLEDALTVGIAVLMSGNLSCMISDLKREMGLA